MNIEQSFARQVFHPAKAPSRWFGIDFHANLYWGCPHGCLYCDLLADCRPGEDFSRVTHRPDVLEVLARELAGKPKDAVIAFGSAADPYNGTEAENRLMRKALEMVDAAGLGAAVTTKSDLVLRDVDVLKRIASHSPLVVLFPISTFNDAVCRKLEPAAPKPSERFRTLGKLSAEGLLCGVKMIPIIPFLNDTEDNVRDIIRSAKAAGARFVYPSFGIQFREGQSERFMTMIEREFPGLRNVFMDTYGMKSACISPQAPKLKKVFVFECKKQKMLYGMKDIVRLIRPDKNVQLKLF